MSVMPQEQQQDTELVTGIITGIVDKGGEKWQVAVRTDPTSQYTRNLWSSDVGLVSQLSQMIGMEQTFLCRISHWTRQDGSPVQSRWIQGVGPQAAAPGIIQPTAPVTVQPVAPTIVTPQVVPVGAVPGIPAQAQPQVAQPQVRISEAERESRIHRQTASKVAAILISHLPQEQRTFDNLIRIAENMVGYYEHGVQGMGHNPGYDDGDPGPQGVPHGDDDVPF